MFVSARRQVLPQFREFERFAATAVNRLRRATDEAYLTALESRLGAMGYARPVTVMVSNGGTLPIDRVVHVPIQTMLVGAGGGRDRRRRMSRKSPASAT
jgi:N-methylhydantoinase A